MTNQFEIRQVLSHAFQLGHLGVQISLHKGAVQNVRAAVQH